MQDIANSFLLVAYVTFDKISEVIMPFSPTRVINAAFSCDLQQMDHLAITCVTLTSKEDC